MKFEDINLCDLDQFERGLPQDVFSFLREEAPVWFHPANELTPDGEGFWVVSKHADLKELLKNHQVFSSETGNGAREGGGTILQDLTTDMGPGLILAMMDPPKHDDVRSLVNQGFFPRNLQYLEPDIRTSVSSIADDMLGELESNKAYDFRNKVAGRLPLEVICKLCGIPKADWSKMMLWGDAAIAYAARDPKADQDALMAQLTDMSMYAFEIMQKLSAEAPNDGVMSQVVHAQIPGADGEPRKLDELELIRFFKFINNRRHRNDP